MSLKFDASKIHEVLKEDMPSISPTQLGRHRLVNALAKKFGPSWRNHPRAQEAIQHFDDQHEKFRTLRSIEAQHPSKMGVNNG